jgi:transposase
MGRASRTDGNSPLGWGYRLDALRGGKAILLGMSKRGDVYLRTLLIHGARSVIRHVENQEGDGWLKRLLGRRNKNIAAVALANKNARMVWALLAHDRRFRPDYAVAVVKQLRKE